MNGYGIDVVILEYVHRNLKGCQGGRSKIWIIDLTRAFKKLKEEQLKEKLNEDEDFIPH